jgi:hypothetical protein
VAPDHLQQKPIDEFFPTPRGQVLEHPGRDQDSTPYHNLSCLGFSPPTNLFFFFFFLGLGLKLGPLGFKFAK